ncbi:hypothetical protein BC826DRAFT_970584 [Russula brevipes]|nr:hypothetical protein BC826DRAFT_970584 [Russula brevipes]
MDWRLIQNHRRSHKPNFRVEVRPISSIVAPTHPPNYYYGVVPCRREVRHYLRGRPSCLSNVRAAIAVIVRDCHIFRIAFRIGLSGRLATRICTSTTKGSKLKGQQQSIGTDGFDFHRWNARGSPSGIERSDFIIDVDASSNRGEEYSQRLIPRKEKLVADGALPAR